MVDSRDYFAQVAGEWDQLRSGYFTEAMRDAAIQKANLPQDAAVADVPGIRGADPQQRGRHQEHRRGSLGRSHHSR